MIKVHAPVALFAYARPDHLRQTINALASATGALDTQLWVFSDGPKNTPAAANVYAVRSLLAEQDWKRNFAEVKVIAADHNKGLARSIIEGVSQVIKLNNRVIVLEDDLLVAADFLKFMNAGLELNASETIVGSLTGYCPLPHPPVGYKHDVYAVPRSCSHGWATWRDRWDGVDWSGHGAERLWQDAALRKRFNATGSDKLDRLRRQLEGRIDSWSIMFNLWHALNGRVALYPVRNLVQNIGFDDSGTHTGRHNRMHTALSQPGSNLIPALPPEDARVIASFRKIYSGSLSGRLRRLIRNWHTPEVVRKLDAIARR